MLPPSTPSHPGPQPLIVVTGGTGAQGGSVARHLLRHGGFRVRCVVRDPTSAKAIELKSLGCDLIRGSYNDLESMVYAFDGAWGVYAVTNYWELLNETQETVQGKTLVDAARRANVRHFIWSTMEHTSEPCAPHWNSKAVVNDYLVQSGVPFTSLYTVFYFENFLNLPYFQLRWSETSAPSSRSHCSSTQSARTTERGTCEDDKGRTLVADWPFLQSDGLIGGFSVAEIGVYAVEAFTNPQKWINASLRPISAIFTPRDVVSAMTSVSGIDVTLVEVSRDDFVNTGAQAKEGWETVRRQCEDEGGDPKQAKGTGVWELWTNMESFYKHDGNPGRDFELTEQINPARKSLYDFVEANIDKLIPPRLSAGGKSKRQC